MKAMLATLIKEPFNDKDWLFETKWDGYRALAHKAKTVKLLSRNDKSFNQRFPVLVKELQRLPGNFILDGEIVILDKHKRSHFQLLQNYLKSQEGSLCYYIFDILSYQGKDLTNLPLIKRKKILHKLLQCSPSKHLKFSKHIEKNGKKLFTQAKKIGLEGIIAKRKESRYVSKRSREWLKIKTGMRQEVVIGGFTKPRGSRKYFGALLVGVYKRGNLVYSGHVGGGFNQALLKIVYQQMHRLEQQKCPFQIEPDPNMPVTWIRPKLVCEVAFSEWTKEGIMRQPIFQGMRTDKPARSVVRE